MADIDVPEFADDESSFEDLKVRIKTARDFVRGVDVSLLAGREDAAMQVQTRLALLDFTCRDFLLEHLDEGEDSVGTRVEIDHMAPTLLDMWADVSVTVADEAEEVARGRHWRFVVDKAKTAERLAAKRAQISGG